MAVDLGAPVVTPDQEVTAGRRVRRARRPVLPYVLILPSLVAIGALFGYPVFLLVRMSFQQLGLFELIQRVTTYVGVDNYRTLLTDGEFWGVVVRTVAFTLVNVAVTMAVGTGIGVLLSKLGRFMRTAVSISLVLAWAVPIITATVLWQWIFDQTYGVLNWLITAATPAEFGRHDWFASGLSTFAVITVIIVWQAVPFVALTVQAGLLTIPDELTEAAKLDGAGPFRVFWSVQVPILRPILGVLTFLSVVWDFKVFTQVWAVRQGGPNGSTVTLPIYLYDVGIASSTFGLAAAGAVVMVGLLSIGLVFYLRRMLRTELA